MTGSPPSEPPSGPDHGDGAPDPARSAETPDAAWRPPDPTGAVTPQFAVPLGAGPLTVPDVDPEARKRRTLRGVIGAAVGMGVNLLLVIVALVLGFQGGAGSDRWIGMQLLLLVGLVVAAPVLFVTGIVLTAVQRTRPFGVGLLIGSALGTIITAGACFAPLAATG